MANKEIWTNNAITTLAANITAAATTATLASGTGALYPNPAAGQFFRATLFAAGSSTGTPNEIVFVTARSGDTVTIQRGQEGTTPTAWNAGDTFTNQVTAGAAANWAQQVDIQAQVNNAAVDTGSANAGVITLGIAPVSLAALTYMPIRVKKAGGPNTGAYSLNVNGLGAQAVTFMGSALLANDLPNNFIFNVMYDGTVFELQTPPGTGRGGPPSGPAGGDLTGNYPSPTIALGVVTNAKLTNMNPGTVKANVTGGPTSPQDVTYSSLLNALGFVLTLGSPWLFQIPNPLGGSPLIVQGGFVAGGDDTEETVTLPSAFPTSCDWTGGTLVTSGLPASGIDGGCYGRVISRSQIAVGVLASGTGTITGINWWAVGH